MMMPGNRTAVRVNEGEAMEDEEGSGGDGREAEGWDGDADGEYVAEENDGGEMFPRRRQSEARARAGFQRLPLRRALHNEEVTFDDLVTGFFGFWNRIAYNSVWVSRSHNVSLSVFSKTRNATKAELEHHKFTFDIGLFNCCRRETKSREELEQDDGSMPQSTSLSWRQLFSSLGLRMSSTKSNTSSSGTVYEAEAGKNNQNGFSSDEETYRTKHKSEIDSKEPKIIIPILTTTLNPFSSLYFVWAMWIILMNIVYAGILEPMFIAFETPILSLSHWTAVVDLTAGIVYLLDIIINFRTGWRITYKEFSKLTFDPKLSAMLFLRTAYCWLGLLALVPWWVQIVCLIIIDVRDDGTQVISKATINVLQILRLFRLISLLRNFTRSRRIRDLIETTLTKYISPFIVYLFSLVIFLVFVMHVFACMVSLNWVVQDLLICHYVMQHLRADMSSL